MKTYLIAASIAICLIFAMPSPGQTACRVTVRAKAEVAAGKLSLADLLAPDTCPALLRSAAAVPLGNVPVAGSVRVLDGSEIRVLLARLVEAKANNIEESASRPLLERIPERMIVRSAGLRASCSDIGARLLASLATGPPELLGEIDCGASERIFKDTPLQFMKPVWDPAQASWEVSARCVQRSDCVPFLLHVPDSQSSAAGHATGAIGETMSRLVLASVRNGKKTIPGLVTPEPLVRAGQTVTLIWEQDGIRLVVPAVCLDAGGAGQRVRARIAPSGRMLPAVVTGAGTVSAAS